MYVTSFYLFFGIHLNMNSFFSQEQRQCLQTQRKRKWKRFLVLTCRYISSWITVTKSVREDMCKIHALVSDGPNRTKQFSHVIVP